MTATANYLIGDVHNVMATLPDASVDLVMTSPPFLALRSYLPDDHPDKGKEVGAERSPADFIDALLDVAEACARVLAPHGTMAIELGDTYSSSGGAGGDYRPGKMRANAPTFIGSNARRPGGQWPLAKSLCLIPESFRWALAYGCNPFNGRTTDPWRLRNVVRWVRPNPPVGALFDKFRPATSELVIACKSGKRWFDMDAVRNAPNENTAKASKMKADDKHELARVAVGLSSGANLGKEIRSNPAGAPPLDWWQISGRGYKGSHYAVYPPELCRRPILAMCPQRVCTTCGVASSRIVDRTRTFSDVTASSGRQVGAKQGGPLGSHYTITREHVGWTDCGHDTWRNGVVLDPFAGSGTTLMVANDLGRDAIGIDIDARNAELARVRVPRLVVHKLKQQPAA